MDKLKWTPQSGNIIPLRSHPYTKTPDGERSVYAYRDEAGQQPDDKDLYAWWNAHKENTAFLPSYGTVRLFMDKYGSVDISAAALDQWEKEAYEGVMNLVKYRMDAYNDGRLFMYDGRMICMSPIFVRTFK